MPSLFDLLTPYRGFIIVAVVLPLGYLFDIAVTWLSWLRRVLARGYNTHAERVAAVQTQVQARARLPLAQQRPMVTGRSSWLNLSTRFVDKSRCHRIDLSFLDQILEVNTSRRTVTLEPGVTVGQVRMGAFPTRPGPWPLTCSALPGHEATLSATLPAVCGCPCDWIQR